MKYRLFILSVAVVLSIGEFFGITPALGVNQAKADDWQEISCAATPFRSTESAFGCRTIKSGTTGPNGQVSLYILRGVKENVGRYIFLCQAGVQSYCGAVPADELKTAITMQRTADAAPKNWGDIRREKGSTYIPFESGTRTACLGFLHYDQAVDNGYRFRAIGHVCTDKNLSDKDTILETAAKEFTNFKR